MIFKNYKKEIFCNLNKKDNKLLFVYGISGFILDFTNKYVVKINYEKEIKNIRKIYTNNAGMQEAYIKIVSRISTSIMIFILIFSVGYADCVVKYFSKNTRISMITRPNNGENEKKLDIVVNDGNDSKEIQIKINAQEYSNEQIEKKIENNYETVLLKLKNKNKSLRSVTSKLNLISSINGIDITWEIDNTDYVDYEGNINWDNVKADTDINIRFNMSCNEVSKQYEIPITIKKNKSNEDNIGKKISDIVNSNFVNSKKVDITKIKALQGYDFYKKKNKENITYIIIAILVAIGLYFAKKYDENSNLKKREEELELDYSGIVSKLTILQESGMNTLGAWEKIISDYESKNIEKRYAYEEMKYAKNRMQSGYSEVEAYIEFGKRCGTQSYIKLSNILERNIKKGSKGMKQILKDEVKEAFEKRKEIARKKGDEAGTKLLLPMGVMLVISIVIVIVPALLTINI